jgi:hypothetical protein
VTFTDPAVVVMNPGIAAATVVAPPPIGSNATPPDATAVDEIEVFSGIGTVRVWPDPAVVVS